MNTLINPQRVSKANEIAGRLNEIQRELKYFSAFHKSTIKLIELEAQYKLAWQEYTKARKNVFAVN